MTTSQRTTGVSARDEATPSVPGDRRPSDTQAKSYRYLRTAMVALLVCLAAAVIYQSVQQDHLLESVSAYYYTPAQAIFVGALIGLAACMIALKGTTPVEDIFLNLGGVFAAVVAIIPTARDADYRAAVRACREAETPLLSDRASNVDCPTVQALADATRANVENNLSALLIVGAFALFAGLFFAWADGTFRRQADEKARRSFWIGLGVAFALWLAGLVARWTSLQWLVDNAHFVAASGLALCILVVALANARRVQDVQPDGESRVKQSVDAARDLLAVRQRRGWYIWIARATLIVAAIVALLMVFGPVTLFWLEFAVAGFFVAFWTAQTIEFR